MATQRDLEQFDVRIVQRNIRRGKGLRKDYDKYLSQLPDVADKAVEIEEHQPLEPKGSGPKG